MKTIYQKLNLACIAILFAFAAKAQTPTTCSTAVTYTYPVTQTITSYTPGNYWFTITTPGAGAYQLLVTNGSGKGKMTKALAYTGSCSSLTLFAADSMIDTTKTSFAISLFNTASTTYYINLSNTRGSAVTFSLSTVRELFILGQLGFLQGSTDTLFGAAIGGSGTPSYTWMPGSLHTAQIVSTATTNVTYTLTYSDALGTLVDTATARPWNPPPTTDCQLVFDGNFENMGTPANLLGNVPLINGLSCTPSGFYTSAGSPTNWVTPTCGTPDYYNYGLTNPVGVPYNVFATTALTPHSGSGYAGFFIYSGTAMGAYNWHEYLEAPLTCSLIAGQVYNVSYWVSLSSATTPYIANIPSVNIGAYLSTSQVGPNNTTGTLNYTPQVNSSTAINNPGT
jgi:hypothetical protein